MNTVFRTVALVAVMIAGPALAADLPVYKAPPPPPAPVWSWTGFYFGGDVGTGRRSETINSFSSPSPGFGAPAIGGAGTAGFGNLPTAQDLGSNFGFGGLHAGFNWQAAPTWLVGVEGDYMFLNRQASNYTPVIATFPGAAAPCPPAGGCLALQTTSTNRYLASARGRVGYVGGPWLVYATAGAAFTDSSHNVIASSSGVGALPAFGTPGVTVGQSWNGSQVGWVAGGGVEFAAGMNWSVRAEYLHYEFGSSSTVLPYAIAGAGGIVGCAPGLCNFNISTSTQRFDTVRVGLSYKFGGGPVYSKY